MATVSCCCTPENLPPVHNVRRWMPLLSRRVDARIATLQFWTCMHYNALPRGEGGEGNGDSEGSLPGSDRTITRGEHDGFRVPCRGLAWPGWRLELGGAAEPGW